MRYLAPNSNTENPLFGNITSMWTAGRNISPLSLLFLLSDQFTPRQYVVVLVVCLSCCKTTITTTKTAPAEEGRIWLHPNFAGHCFYVRDQEEEGERQEIGIGFGNNNRGDEYHGENCCRSGDDQEPRRHGRISASWDQRRLEKGTTSTRNPNSSSLNPSPPPKKQWKNYVIIAVVNSNEENRKWQIQLRWREDVWSVILQHPCRSSFPLLCWRQCNYVGVFKVGTRRKGEKMEDLPTHLRDIGLH